MSTPKVPRYPKVAVPSAFVRLKRYQFDLLEHMLLRYALDCANERPALWRVELPLFRLIQEELPEHAPYDVRFTCEQWGVVSKALRPVQAPAPGSDDMRARGLYRYFIQRGYGRVPSR